MILLPAHATSCRANIWRKDAAQMMSKKMVVANEGGRWATD